MRVEPAPLDLEGVTKKRIAGAFIDLIPLLVLYLIMGATLGDIGVGSGSSTSNGVSSSVFNVNLGGWDLVHFIGLALTCYSLSEGLTGTTLGKWIMGLRVVRLDLQPYRWSSVLIRNLFRIIDGLPILYLFGIIVVGISGRKQRVGDHIAGTVVVRAGEDFVETSDSASSPEYPNAESPHVPNPVGSLGPRIAMVIAAVALISVVSIALSPRAENGTNAPPRVQMPPLRSLQFLANSSFLDLDRALAANDFTNFHSVISEQWKNQITVGQLSQAFQGGVNARLRFQNIADALPVFERSPSFDENGVLTLSGHYLANPLAIYFQLGYVYEEPTWKLVGINFELRR